MGIYDYEAKKRDGSVVPLKEFEGKVLLIVNTATGCGFTPQYKGLEELYEKHHEKGLEILDFPCNQFAGQAPGTDAEIHEFCTLKYNTQFDQFAKIDVNGENEHPLYTYLKEQKKGLFGKAIKWNFTKFLVDRNGNVVKRYAPTTTPENIEEDILKLL
ncbi:MAG: glutathione peroxidase [Clostridia bacterium]|nr:glutathione peroxidase [Clostridia bacterium]